MNMALPGRLDGDPPLIEYQHIVSGGHEWRAVGPLPSERPFARGCAGTDGIRRFGPLCVREGLEQSAIGAPDRVLAFVSAGKQTNRATHVQDAEVAHERHETVDVVSVARRQECPDVAGNAGVIAAPAVPSVLDGLPRPRACLGALDQAKLRTVEQPAAGLVEQRGFIHEVVGVRDHLFGRHLEAGEVEQSGLQAERDDAFAPPRLAATLNAPHDTPPGCVLPEAMSSPQPLACCDREARAGSLPADRATLAQERTWVRIFAVRSASLPRGRELPRSSGRYRRWHASQLATTW